jgi:hypothetical protein
MLTSPLLLQAVKNVYDEYLNHIAFFSDMGGKDYHDVVEIWTPHGNCHILSKVLESRLKKTLSATAVDIFVVGPKKTIDEEWSSEYEYHTAVIVRDSQLNLCILLDPWSFFPWIVVLDALNAVDYKYLCLGKQRVTVISYNPIANTLMHKTQLNTNTSLVAILELHPLSEKDLASLFTEHQKNLHKSKKPSRKFIVRDWWFAVDL